MGTPHVFLESNWIVACFAPSHFQVPAAASLLQAANEGDLTLHVPSICLSEARSVIRRKYQPRNQADPVRNFLKWSIPKGLVSESDNVAVRQLLDAYERETLRDLELLELTLSQFSRSPGVDVFPLTENMLQKSLELGLERLELQPFDSSILAAVLGRATALRLTEPEADLFFCEADSDLQPWDRYGQKKLTLAQLYDDARIWVYGDFLMTTPARPADWLL